MRKRKRNKRKEIRAYFTVEASVIVPLILGFFLFLIYIIIYQYNRCLLEQDTAILAMRGCIEQKWNVFQDNQQLLQVMQQQAGKVYTEKYTAIQLEGWSVSLKNNKVKVKGNGEVTIPFVPMELWTKNKGWKLEAQYENYLINPTTFIRICQKLKNQKNGG